QFSGTARDAAPGVLKTSGVVRVSMKQVTGAGSPRCYNNTLNIFEACPGGAYPANRIWFTTATLAVNPDPAQPSTWIWNTSAIGWTNESQYNVIALARDKAGNEKPAGGVETPDLSFLLQTPQADATITTPLGPDERNSRSTDMLNVAGSGSNLRAVDSVQIMLKRLKEPASWWYEPTLSWVNYATYTWYSSNDGSWAQAINGVAAFTVNNASYTFTVTAYNSSAQPDPSPAVRTIVIDDTKPAGFIGVPNKPYINAMPAVSGTATDPLNITQPSLQNVYIRIKDIENGYYWTGSSFSITALELAAVYTPQTTVAWSTATAVNSALQDGRRYKVFLQPKDKAGNIEANESNMPAYQVLFDTSPPTAYFAYPGDRQVLRTLSPITGTAYDPVGFYSPGYKSDLSLVELQIYDGQADKRWDDGSGGFIISASSFKVVSGTDTWTYSHANLESGLGTGKYYTLQARALDRAGSVQAGFADVVSSRTFIWDKTPPTSDIIQPLALGKYRPDNLTGNAALNGTSSDASLPFVGVRLSTPQIHLSYLAGSTTYYWTGSSFSSWTVTFDGAWQTAIGTDTWRYPFDGTGWVSDRDYTLRVRAFDKAEPMGANGGNEQNPWTVRAFSVDGTPPVSRVSTPTAGSYIQSALPQLSGTSYGGASGLQPGAPGLKLRIYYVYGTDTWYWKGTTALGWSSAAVTELPVDFTASASTITWSYPPVG
ncbi:MAG: hypothetical protein Q8O90_12025, partial [Elusimicrobiota bacterium]|nr:hypothetical protein [Elusimicrobiota bacterium]